MADFRVIAELTVTVGSSGTFCGFKRTRNNKPPRCPITSQRHDQPIERDVLVAEDIKGNVANANRVDPLKGQRRTRPRRIPTLATALPSMARSSSRSTRSTKMANT